MSKRPPMANTTGKLALAGKRKQARQILDRKHRERNRRDLLSLVGKNSSLAVASWPGMPSGRNERYAVRVASAEKARLDIDLLAVSTDIRAHGISDVAEKIVFDGDGGKSKTPPIAELLPIAEHAVGEEESYMGKRRTMRTLTIRRDHQDLLAAERG
jgi:hypothetical protein